MSVLKITGRRLRQRGAFSSASAVGPSNFRGMHGRSSKVVSARVATAIRLPAGALACGTRLIKRESSPASASRRSASDIDYVIVWKLSRLSRSPLLDATLELELLDHLDLAKTVASTEYAAPLLGKLHGVAASAPGTLERFGHADPCRRIGL